MKLSSSDFLTLSRAADVADAQRDLVEMMKSRAAKRRRRENSLDPALMAAIAVVGLMSLLAIGSLA